MAARRQTIRKGPGSAAYPTARNSAASADHLGQTPAEALARLQTSAAGLGAAQARALQREYGRNEIILHRGLSPIRMLAREFTALFPLLLTAAAVLSFYAYSVSPEAGYELIGVALIGVVTLNALVSFIQNYRVEKLMLAFLDYIPKQVAVRREAGQVMLDAREVVPGDILYLQEGDKICADGFLLEANQLLVDESILSGESEPLARHAAGSEIDEATLVRSGATVVKGNGLAVVTAIGRKTGLGEVSHLSQAVQRDLTPMQRELSHFVHRITLLALGIGGLFFLVGFAIGNTFWTNLIFAIGIIVANVPEGLLPTVTLALSQSSVRMARRNAVIKHILSVETLGSTTVICTDKTGTLTRNRLHLESLYFNFAELSAEATETLRGSRTARTLIEIMGLCNEVIVSDDKAARGEHRFKGDPTEIAMAEFADRELGLGRLHDRFERLHSQPFDVEQRYMAATFKTADGALYLSAKGAPEAIEARCSSVFSEGLVRPLKRADRDRILKQAAGYAEHGLRVLALAYQAVEQIDAAAENLIFVGLVALVDPPRPEVPAAVKACQDAGIRIIVMSGDKGETVAYIARRLGIVRRPRIIDGEELARMDPASLQAALDDQEVVFARIAPEQKLGLVEALKNRGEVVAVTGDGVNDAPALKRADIGISMGLRGTDVAKEASDIILLDDNFATLVKAIEEGRSVYDNIRKFITYILTSNVPEILPFIAYVLLPIPLPITVVQILAIDLITDILPAIGLGNERPEADIMQRPPRRRDERLVDGVTFFRGYGLIGPVEAALAFVVFFAILLAGGWQWGADLAEDTPLYGQAAGAFLATVVFSQMGNVMACRTNRQSAFDHLRQYNGWILAGLGVELGFILLIFHVPVLQLLFTTAPLPAWAWALIATAPFLVFATEELRKWVLRRLLRPGS